MVKVLSERELNGYFSILNSAQKEYSNDFIKQSKKSKWLEVLAGKKGVRLETSAGGKTTNLSEEWQLIDILDAGPNNRPYRCECGQSLRHQFIVCHPLKKQRLGLGSTCIESYTNLSPEIVADIKRGFHDINIERDEIVIKYGNGERTDLKKYSDIVIPDNYLKQYHLGLPFSDRQLKELEKLLKEAEVRQRKEHEEKKKLIKTMERKETFYNLNKQQQQQILSFSKEERAEILDKIKAGNFTDLKLYNGINIPESISRHAELGLPFTYKQLDILEKIYHSYMKKQRIDFENQKKREYERKKEETLQLLNRAQKDFVSNLPLVEKNEMLDLLINNGKSQFHEDIKDLDLPGNIFYQLELQLPLLKKQHEMIYEATIEKKNRTAIKETELTYELIEQRHLETLKAVRSKQDKLSEKMKLDWISIQEFYREFKSGKFENYNTFKLRLSNIIIPLKIKGDKFLS